MPIRRENTSMSDSFKTPDQVIDQLIDTDPGETAEWQASFDAALLTNSSIPIQVRQRNGKPPLMQLLRTLAQSVPVT